MKLSHLIAKAIGDVTEEPAKARGAKAPPPAGAKVTSPVRVKGEEVMAPPSPPTTKKQRYFDYVAETTRRASEPGIDLVRRAKEAANISATTAETYAATYARRKAVVEKGGELMKGVSRASWHSVRAAVMHGLALEAARAKSMQEKAYSSDDLDAAIAWAQRRRLLVDVATATGAAEPPKERKPRQTKRATLPDDPDWRQRVYDAATKAQKPGVAVAWASGCRPAELETGVDVTLSEGLLHIDVPGRKVTEYSGQPQRCITIDPNSAPGRALLEILNGKTQMTVRRGAAVFNNDFSRIRERLRKTGGVIWSVSPYSMRHQMSADAKIHFKEILNEDEAIDAVASLLGHRVTRSQERYGHPSQAKGGGGLVAVKATHEIKENRAEFKRNPVPAAPRPRSDP